MRKPGRRAARRPRRVPSQLQMVILHLAKLTRCHGFEGRMGRCDCRRCWTIRGAKRELKKLGVEWVPGVTSDAIGPRMRLPK